MAKPLFVENAAKWRYIMLLWTIQHKNAYETLLETGTLRADEMNLFCKDDFLYAYQWISEQMEKHIGLPEAGIHYCIWAWYQWEGVRKCLDMRSHRRWTEKGTPIVLLTIDVPDEFVLLSDFDIWHCVLNNSYLPLSEKDEIENPTTSVKLESWNKIFQIDIQTDYWNTPRSTQATFWELKKEWVLKAERFISS